MKRATERKDKDEVTLLCSGQEAWMKLASYEDAHEAVLKEYDRVANRSVRRRRKVVYARSNRKPTYRSEDVSLQNVLSFISSVLRG